MSFSASDKSPLSHLYQSRLLFSIFCMHIHTDDLLNHEIYMWFDSSEEKFHYSNDDKSTTATTVGLFGVWSLLHPLKLLKIIKGGETMDSQNNDDDSKNCQD